MGLSSFRKEFDNPSPNIEGIIASFYDIGCFLGAMLAFLTADKFGRKGSIFWGSIIMVIGTILQTSPVERVQLIIARVITGIGNGVNTVNVPIWQSESFRSHNRGVRASSLLHWKYVGWEADTCLGFVDHSKWSDSFWIALEYLYGAGE